MLPFTAPLAERVVFEAVSFEVFWPWILGRYLRPAHPNDARSMWKAMGDRMSTPATLAEDGYEFTHLIPRSDWMDAVLRGDEAAMRNPVLNDTVELTLSFWPTCSARLAGALNYYTVSPHATGPGSTPYFWGGGARGGPPAGAGGNRPRHGTGRGAAGRPPSVRRHGPFHCRDRPHARRSSAPCHLAAPRGQAVSDVRGV